MRLWVVYICTSQCVLNFFSWISLLLCHTSSRNPRKNNIGNTHSFVRLIVCSFGLIGRSVGRSAGQIDDSFIDWFQWTANIPTTIDYVNKLRQNEKTYYTKQIWIFITYNKWILALFCLFGGFFASVDAAGCSLLSHCSCCFFSRYALCRSNDQNLCEKFLRHFVSCKRLVKLTLNNFSFGVKSINGINLPRISFDFFSRFFFGFLLSYGIVCKFTRKICVVSRLVDISNLNEMLARNSLLSTSHAIFLHLDD